MLHYARLVLKMMQDMEDELSDFASSVKGHVRIHAIAAALAQFLLDDLQKFMQRYPLIKFDIEERVGAAIVRAVAEGHVDLGIFAHDTPAPGLQLFPYHADTLVLAVPTGHPLAGHAELAFKDVLGYEFVGPHIDSSLHKLLTARALEVGQLVRQRIRVSSFDCLCRMVASGLGIGILPLGILAPMLPTLALGYVRLTDPRAERVLQIGVRDFDSLPATARAFVDQLRLPREARSEAVHDPGRNVHRVDAGAVGRVAINVLSGIDESELLAILVDNLQHVGVQQCTLRQIIKPRRRQIAGVMVGVGTVIIALVAEGDAVNSQRDGRARQRRAVIGAEGNAIVEVVD